MTIRDYAGRQKDGVTIGDGASRRKDGVTIGDGKISKLLAKIEDLMVSLKNPRVHVPRRMTGVSQ